MAGVLPDAQVEDDEDVANPDNENLDVENGIHITNVQTSDGNDLPETVPNPSVGMAFESYHEVYNFYRRYGEQKGFGIRVGNSTKRKDGRCRRILLNCWKADKALDKVMDKLQTSAKTDCQAKIIARLRGDGLLHLVEVVHEHNHLLSPLQAQSARSSSCKCLPVGVENQMRCRKWHQALFTAQGEEHESEQRAHVAQGGGHASEHPVCVAQGGSHENEHQAPVAHAGGHENEHPARAVQAGRHDIEHPAFVAQGGGYENELERYDCLVTSCLRVAKVGAISEDKFQLSMELLGEVEQQLLDDTTDGDTPLEGGETVESDDKNSTSKQGIPNNHEILDPLNVRRRSRPPKEMIDSNIENSSTSKRKKETVKDSNLSHSGDNDHILTTP